MSRVSHSVLFHHKHRKLYIFGGQRGKHYLTVFLIYDVDGAELTSQTDSKNVPQSGFTQRAAIDCDKDEIYVLASLSKEKECRNLNINSFWLFPLAKREWCCVYKSDPRSDNCYLMNQNACPEPCPRYAHQNVYDAAKQAHFLFGGNPGMNSHFRLDDFWMLLLETPTRDNILRYCKYLLRKKEYEEVAQTDPLAAIRFLLLYDISDPAQLKEFNILASLLFKSNASAADGESEPTSLLTCSLSGGGGQKHPNEHDPDGDNAKMMRAESPKAADASSISSLTSECSQTARAIPSTSAATSPSSYLTCSSSHKANDDVDDVYSQMCRRGRVYLHYGAQFGLFHFICIRAKAEISRFGSSRKTSLTTRTYFHIPIDTGSTTSAATRLT